MLPPEMIKTIVDDNIVDHAAAKKLRVNDDVVHYTAVAKKLRVCNKDFNKKFVDPRLMSVKALMSDPSRLKSPSIPTNSPYADKNSTGFEAKYCTWLDDVEEAFDYCAFCDADLNWFFENRKAGGIDCNCYYLLERFAGKNKKESFIKMVEGVKEGRLLPRSTCIDAKLKNFATSPEIKIANNYVADENYHTTGSLVNRDKDYLGKNNYFILGKIVWDEENPKEPSREVSHCTLF